ncbi:hypothetical protein MNBD_PLANCTO03-2118 [hydrothermal vent metagenome]|uniref:Uncharacterized protein n=1 Tax=hydrothermal vent metagenome TaxID=652676 RepID=A0A3B1D7H8_9ZZZZ
MGEDGKTIVLVGHCNPDIFAMRMALGRYAPGAEFVAVNDSAGLQEHAKAAGFLVNRVLDGDFGTGSGLALIEGLSPETRARATLVSDLADAQTEAEKLGAAAGFGKSGMYGDAAKACIERMVGS